MFDNLPGPQSPLVPMKPQMHADNRQENCLDVLQGMINGILIETGKALRASTKAGGRSAAQSAIRLRSSIPATTDQFHLALDQLEADIVRAQAVLARDLGELRAKNPTTVPTSSAEEVSTVPKADTQKSNTDDVKFIDNSIPLAIHTTSKPTIAKPESVILKPGASGDAPNTQERNSQQSAPAGTTSQPPQPSESKTQAEKGQKQESVGDGAMATSGGAATNDIPPLDTPAPTTTAPDAASLSLDMIFEDMDVEGGTKSVPDGLNFDDIDFTVTNNDGQDMRLDNNGQDMQLDNNGQDMQLDNNATQDLDALMFGDVSGNNNNNNNNSNNNNSNSNNNNNNNNSGNNNNGNPDNVASLLPGLGNYANADSSQDFDMSSFLPNDPPNDAKKTDTGAGESHDDTKADNDDLFGDFGGIANESNFDDLLDGMDFGDGGDGGDDTAGGEMMGSNEEFDNAFFGIE